MRAVHFHPHGLPVVLTAEVQDPSPTPDLPATLTEEGPYAPAAEQVAANRSDSRSMEEDEEEEAAATGAGGSSGTAAAPPPSGELPIPSPQLLRGAAGSDGSRQQEAQHPAAGVYVATADGPVPVGQLTGASGVPSAGAALSGPLHQLHLGRAGSASPPPAGDATGPLPASLQAAGLAPRPGTPGWVPPGSAQLPPSMVPTGWELPFPASLFTGGQAQGERGGGGGPGSGAAAGSWEATAASLPQVMAAFSAAAWNIIGEEQPPRVRLRLWR